MGQLCFPLCQPRVPGAHVCHVFVATFIKVAVLPDRLRRCEPPPSRNVFSRPLCSLGRLAQLCFRHAVLPQLAPSTTKQMSIGRDWGPRPQATALRALGSRGRHALGRRRFAPPCRSRSRAALLPKTFRRDEGASLHASDDSSKAPAGHRPIRPLANRGDDAWRPPGRSSMKSLSSMVRVPSRTCFPGVVRRHHAVRAQAPPCHAAAYKRDAYRCLH